MYWIDFKCGSFYHTRYVEADSEKHAIEQVKRLHPDAIIEQVVEHAPPAATVL